jgi:hypothetical protein
MRPWKRRPKKAGKPPMIPGARPGLKVVFAEAKRYETVNSPKSSAWKPDA